VAADWRARFIGMLNRFMWEDEEYLATPNGVQDQVDAIIEDAIQAICKVAGHRPAMDHCGKREHDLCEWCGTRMPGQAKRPPRHAERL
jgi:hypothetical protein